MGGSCFVQEPYTPETYTPNKLRLKELPELDNFHSCEIRFDDGQPWPSAEAWFQAQKFPDDPELQDKIRTSDGGVESFIEGRSGNNIRPDWEEVKVDIMYAANRAKFEQSTRLRAVLLATRGPILALGGTFWKTWNEVLLERIRAELAVPAAAAAADNGTTAAARLHKEIMNGYRQAAAADYASDAMREKVLGAVTRHAAQRELMPVHAPEAVATVLWGRAVGSADVAHAAWMLGDYVKDPSEPESHGFPVYCNAAGGHLFLASKRGEFAWVIDRAVDTSECSGFATFRCGGKATPLPLTETATGKQWQIWNRTCSKLFPMPVCMVRAAD